jgi:hypothetical protein
MEGKIKIAREVSGRIMVTFSYKQTSVAKIKTIVGRRWHPKGLKCFEIWRCAG